MKKLLTMLAAMALASSVWAETYTYTGVNYADGDIVNHTTSNIGTVGDYLNTMKITGSLSTSAPLAANLDGADVTALITGYSFSDGLTAFASSDANIRLIERFVVSTNASGQIIGFNVMIERWQAGSAPHALNNRLDYLYFVNDTTAVGMHNARCSVIGVSLTGVADSCTSPNIDSNTSEGGVATGGVWSGPVGTITNVPTLSEWGMMILASFMVLFGMAHTHRRQA